MLRYFSAIWLLLIPGLIGPADAQETESKLTGGVGLVIVSDQARHIIVDEVIPNSPAAAKLQPGDRILVVNGQDVANGSLTNACNALRGKPGTSVIVTLMRGQEKVMVVLTRVDIPALMHAANLSPAAP